MTELARDQNAVPTQGLISLVARILTRPVDRLTLVLIGLAATLATFAETIVLVVISLAALQLAGDSAVAADLPLGLPLDELDIGALIVVGFGALLARLLLLLANAYLSARLGASVLYRWRRRVLLAFQNAPWQTQAGLDDGYMQTVTQTHVARTSGMLQQVSAATTAGVSFLTFFLGALMISPLGAIGLISFGVGLFLLLRPFTRLTQHQSTMERAAAKEYARLLGEASSMALEHRVLGSSVAVGMSLEGQLLNQCSAARRQLTLQKMTPQLYTGLGYVAILGGLTLAGRLDPGQVAAVGAVALMMLRSIGYGHAFQGATQAVAAAAPYGAELLEAVSRLELSSPPAGTVTADTVRALELREASIGYGGTPVAAGVSVTLGAGESVGIVGHSGGGKSTLALTLLGLLTPLDGDYLINGIRSTDYSPEWWHRSVSFVPQQPTLFDGTVRENIRCYRDNISDDAIEAAAMAAHLTKEVAEWSAGLDHPVGPRGGRLSGGQRQRVCIARALVGRPSVLVLDEPTSALDRSAEASITDVLASLRESCTLVVVAHRLSTLEFCDRILRVESGEVTELGSDATVQLSPNTLAPAVPVEISTTDSELVQ